MKRILFLTFFISFYCSAFGFSDTIRVPIITNGINLGKSTYIDTSTVKKRDSTTLYTSKYVGDSLQERLTFLNNLTSNWILFSSDEGNPVGSTSLTWDSTTQHLETDGFFRQGDLGTLTKKYVFSGTFPSSQGSSVTITIPVSISVAKVVSITMLGQYSTNAWMPRNFTLFNGYQFDFYTSNASPFDIFVYLSNSNSSNMVSMPFVGVIEYTE